ncbi:MAG: hypothetical protein IIV20_01600 [Bacteroidaceae bacterium]|nr:hypothetical protein [Bacteroidaceae bacterium]
MEGQNEIAVISSTEALQAVTSAEIDKQIATAKMYPRDVMAAVNEMQQLALFDEETAESCFYHLERRAKDGSMTIIEGPSIRLAEIAAASWGNLRIATRIVGNDGRMVTVEAVAHDLQKNVASSKQVARSIMTKNGQTFSADMQVMTINAASSLARRNAIYDVVPKVYVNKLVAQCQEFVKGQAVTGLRDKVQKVVKAFAKYGVTPEMLCEKMEVATIDDINADMVVTLIGIGNSLKDGQTNVEEEFPQLRGEQKPSKMQEAAEKARAAVKGKKAETPKDPAEMSEEEIEAAMSEEQTKLNME